MSLHTLRSPPASTEVAKEVSDEARVPGTNAGASKLTFEDVSRVYQSVAAVSHVSLSLEPGEVSCLLGPSGCGKTTLLRMTAGIERPTSGRILLDGLEVSGPSRFVPPEQRSVGLMFQDFALFPHLSILGNVMFGLRHMPHDRAETLARTALGRVGMQAWAQSYPHALSGGEQQRVALARALVPGPQIMLMDEPFSGLDQRLRESVRDETMALLHEARTTTLLVTHDPVEAMGLADRIFLMRHGRLVQSGTPAELYRKPADAGVARYFCDFNELDGIVCDGLVETPLGRIAAPGFANGSRVQVLVRPQGIVQSSAELSRPGLIVQANFQGDQMQCAVVFPGLEKPVRVRTAACTDLRVGQTLTFKIEFEHVFVFADAVSIPIS